ncbi:MAG: hypothetical protein LBD21_03100 [Tannerellaceae bacterium]|jgi:hypothetical protein|nr:hypothetical protein [Tannerellaceae bacterium]
MNENEHIETKEELLLQTARRMASELAPDGFVSEARERTLSLYGPHKEMKVEILLQVPRQRFKTILKVFPQVQLCSKSIKRWWKSESLPAPRDVFFSARLDEISPRTPPFRWIISGGEQERSIPEMISHIRTFVVPLFEAVLDTDKAVGLMCQNIWAIGRGMTPCVCTPPLEYVVYYGSIELGKKLFETSLKKNTHWAQQVALRYKELDRRPDISTEQIFASGERWINLAYVCGFRP